MTKLTEIAAPFVQHAARQALEHAPRQADRRTKMNMTVNGGGLQPTRLLPPTGQRSMTSPPRASNGRMLFASDTNAGQPRLSRTIITVRDSAPKNAELQGYHGTTAAALESMGKSRDIDVGRTGKNFGGKSTLGPGLYLTERKYDAENYKDVAAGVAGTPGQGQVAAVYTVPGDRPVDIFWPSAQREDLTVENAEAQFKDAHIIDDTERRGVAVITPKGIRELDVVIVPEKP